MMGKISHFRHCENFHPALWKAVLERRNKNIYERYIPHEVTMQYLADEFDLSVSRIRQIIQNESWKHR